MGRRESRQVTRYRERKRRTLSRQPFLDGDEAAGQAGQGGRALFEWLLQLDMPELQQLLAFCAAVSVDTISGSENTPPQDVAELMGALNLDMADWWQPTRENYLDHVSKDRILSVMTEAASPAQAKAMRGLRKEQLAQKAEEELTALRWLPLNFRPGSGRLRLTEVD